jgi:hypothetical protein
MNPPGVGIRRRGIDDIIVHVIQDMKQNLAIEFYQISGCLCCREYKSSTMILKTLKSELWDEQGHPMYCSDNMFCLECYTYVYQRHENDHIQRNFKNVNHALQYYNPMNNRSSYFDEGEEEENETDDSENEWYDAMEREAEYQEELLQMEAELGI